MSKQKSGFGQFDEEAREREQPTKNGCSLSTFFLLLFALTAGIALYCGL